MARKRRPVKTDKRRRSRDQTTNASKEELQLLKKRERSQSKPGMNCQRIREVFPKRDRAPCEKMYRGDNNSYIVLGRDRSASRADGYGGKGQTQCGMIDLVAGHQGAYVNDDGVVGPPETRRKISPNFFLDSARIYMSQRCDIDEYFGLADGSEGFNSFGKPNSTSRSGIGMKADHVRIIGRRHIKIITGRAKVEGAGPDGEANGQGGENFGAGGIDLIAGNYTDPENIGMKMLTGMTPATGMMFKRLENPKLQPVVKGHNLIECIKWIEETITALQAMIVKNTKAISGIAGVMGTFAAGSPLNPVAGLAIGVCSNEAVQSIIALAENIAELANNVGLSNNFLDDRSRLYICSRHINVT